MRQSDGSCYLPILMKLAFSGAADEPGSNSNLLEMLGMQNRDLVDGKTINEAWNNMVTDVAGTTASAANDLVATTACLTMRSVLYRARAA